MSLIYKKEKPKVYTHREVLGHQSWCLKNNIKIYFQTKDGYNFGQVVIVCKGKKTVEDKYYNQRKIRPKDEKWWERIWQLYTEYYLKYNKDE